MREKPKSRATKTASCDLSPQAFDRGLHKQIAARAYDLYVTRGYLDGFDCEDWLEAERQILAEMESTPMPLPRPVTEHAA